MNFAALFIRRPIATTLIMIAICAFGLMAYRELPVAALPNVDFPTIEVRAQLSGASAETMASSVATPLEREFSSIDGILSMSSASSEGATTVVLQFDQKRNIDSAAQDVQSAIARAVPRLPRDMTSTPSYRKVNPADQSIVLLALSSDTLPLYEVNEYAEGRLAPAIAQTRGVAQVQVYGSQKYAVRIQADPRKLASLEIGLDEVAEAIREANVNLPSGTLHGENKQYSIETNGQLDSAGDYDSVVVTHRNGAPVYLRDIGRSLDSVENNKTAAWYASKEGMQQAVILAIQKQPGANTVEVAQAVTELLPRFRKDIPPSVDLELLFDRSNTVRESVHDVELTLLITLVLVVMVIFLFLRQVVATVIPSLSMPLAILATFALIHPLGFSLNNLSLMALTLSVGFVVDDAIVVLENVVRHVEMGKPPMQAAFDGTKEIGFTILSMTASLVAVFIPFLFMGGILGSLFHEFAVTIAIAISVSGFVSLSLTPMMAARLMGRHAGPKQHGRLFHLTERAFDAAASVYERTLAVVIRHQRLTLAASGAVLAGTLALFYFIPKGFLPTEDTDQINITAEAVDGSAFDAVVDRQNQVAEIVRNDPDVEAFFSTAGARGGRGATNQGRIFARLEPRAERERSAQQIATELSARLRKLPGMRAFVTIPPPVRLGGRSTKSEYQLTLQSAQTDVLYEHAPRLAEELAKSPILIDVATDVEMESPQIDVEIDRERAATLGISVNRVEDTLYSAYGSRQISTIFGQSDSYSVILELDPTTQREPDALKLLSVRSNNSALVPLEAVADIRPSVGPLTVNHAGQLPAATISFNVKPGHSLSEAVAVVNEQVRSHLPSTISASFQGSAEAFESSLSGLGLLLLVAIFVIYIVLGILYESALHPITILSALPFAGFGALATLMLFGKELDVFAFVGVILLVGLVKKNGIMMVDFAVEARSQGASAEQAIQQACAVRFRPIMMTTLAALFGTLPIALGIGAGAESRQPLGLAVVGGLFFSQMLTLYVTPVFYVQMERFGAWLGRQRAAVPVPAE